ncbi:winged helix-turn-helix transcriptional regulator [Halosimplex aquaticum]|uniref:Winged helix-turn-helix transcriptional regulator n=1 Tax=Halosimplex aquaticum TaxID=3026162 RepID=A0ABD5Y120_9EURY|nr:ArsR family transcriptional regulator [Halosimplex aquaticum]
MTGTDTRARIAAHVAENPGVYFSELVRQLDLAPGQVQYHLRRLDDVVAADLYGRTHYYPPDCDDFERRALAALRRETAADVVVTLLRRGPSAPAEVAGEIDVARSTLEWHLDRLTDLDLVAKRRDERGRVTLVLERPEETARLLRTVEPSLPDRLVDRFTRLLDRLLAE